jgi:hypothetical protein
MARTKRIREKSPGVTDAPSAAGYIADMARELRGLAAANHIDFLAYLLAMAEDEARAEAARAGERQAHTEAA